jgi:uncharacterized protein (DUF3084 family)
MKHAVPWLLVAILLGGVYFLYSMGKERDAKMAQLQQQNPDVAALRAENERLKQAPAANAELERLRKENEDLPRLRSEVGQLRTENQRLTNDLQKAQSQRGKTQQQQSDLVTQNESLAAENQALRTQTQQIQTQNRANACIENLRQIDGAKQQWALEKRASPNAVPTAMDLAPYLPNRALPTCPGGGIYTINSVSLPPTCSVPGHALPK